MINLKFVNIGIIVHGSDKMMRINPNFYHLKSYYEFKGNHFKKVNWLPRILDPWISVNEIVDQVAQENINVLCLSFFSWNHDKTMMVAKIVKRKFPHIKIIAGGPNLWAHKDENFFIEHSFIDYVVYGDGEEAFSEIIDSIVENRQLKDDQAVNIVTKEKKYPFRVFKDLNYQNTSAILSCKKDIKEDVEYFYKKELEVVIHWERARGCPYKCSFCDWSSGLHHKVTRSKSDWKSEIDFLFSLNMSITPSDANWGIFKEDIEITQYAAERGNFYILNLAKLQKDRAFEMSRIIFRENEKKSNPNQWLKLSFQDLDEDVLNAIERPEIPWIEHKSYILDFVEEFPKAVIIGEIILGLPNQKRQNLINQFYEFEKVSIQLVFAHLWEVLPNSPAYDEEYQRKYQIEFKKFTSVIQTFNSIEDIHTSEKNGDAGWTNSTFVIKNNFMDFEDIIFTKLVARMYGAFKIKDKTFPFSIIENLIIPSLSIEAKRVTVQILKEGIYGICEEETGAWYDLETYFMDDNNVKKFLMKYQIATDIHAMLNIYKKEN